VINAAAYTAVDQAEAEENLAVAINGEGAGHVAEAADRIGAPLLRPHDAFAQREARRGLGRRRPARQSDLGPRPRLGAARRRHEGARRSYAGACADEVVVRLLRVLSVLPTPASRSGVLPGYVGVIPTLTASSRTIPP
jgi:dTDP-4-dehydrorhamnose reductase